MGDSEISKNNICEISHLFALLSQVCSGNVISLSPARWCNEGER